jgi:hypothetical protein
MRIRIQIRSISQRHGSADPDPHQNVMDPQHWFSELYYFEGGNLYLYPKMYRGKICFSVERSHSIYRMYTLFHLTFLGCEHFFVVFLEDKTIFRGQYFIGCKHFFIVVFIGC